MHTASNYARIINFLNAGSGLEKGYVEVLSYVICQQEIGVQTKVTDLVRCLKFGTGPTVQRKVTQLEALGLIKLTRSPTDGRAKIVKLSAKGVRYLEEQNTKLLDALKHNSR